MGHTEQIVLGQMQAIVQLVPISHQTITTQELGNSLIHALTLLVRIVTKESIAKVVRVFQLDHAYHVPIGCLPMPCTLPVEGLLTTALLWPTVLNLAVLVDTEQVAMATTKADVHLAPTNLANTIIQEVEG